MLVVTFDENGIMAHDDPEYSLPIVLDCYRSFCTGR
jgi:hypothetical protein